MLNSDPLMFIETVTTKGLSQGQKVFDSRYNTVKKEEKLELPKEPMETITLENKINAETLSKLETVIELYKISRPVICDIVTAYERFEGIPFLKDEEKVVIKQNASDISINLQDIQDVFIIRI